MDFYTAGKKFIREIYPRACRGKLDGDIIGIELEIEEFRPDPWLRHFPEGLIGIHDDGSLRNDGGEVVTVPMGPIETERFLRYLQLAYKELDYNYSHRCSIHVHVNAVDFPLVNFKSMLASYIVCTNLFFSMVDPYRKASSFCYPIAEIGLNKRTFNEDFWMDIASERYKYNDLNLYSLAKHGTLEFRHMHGHDNVDLLRRWVNICRNFVNFFKDPKLDNKRITEMILGLNSLSNYDEFIKMIWGENPFSPGLELVKELSRNTTIAKGIL